MGPEIIILNTALEISEFRNKISELAMLDEIYDNEIIGIIFDYIPDLEFSEAYLLEYVVTIQDQFINRYSDSSVYDLGKALTQFGFGIINQLTNIGAYRNGFMWYKFNGFCCNDIILKKQSEAEIFN